MSRLTKSLVVAAAVAALYGAYSLGKNSNDSTQSKPLEEAVCEEIDTQGIYDEGRSDGYLAGLRHGINEGRITGEREGREDGFERGKQYGLNACGEERYNEGLKACDDSRYADGMIEGEELGLEEGRRRFLGSGSRVWEFGEIIEFETERIVDGKRIAYTLREDNDGKRKQIRIFNAQGLTDTVIWDGNPPIHADLGWNDLPINSADGIADFVCKKDEDSRFMTCYERNEDFQANQELFLWADQRMREETEGFSQDTED